MACGFAGRWGVGFGHFQPICRAGIWRKAWLWDAHRIRPLLDTRELWREDWDALPAQPGLPKLRPLHPDRVDNVLHSGRGEVFCRCPATGEMRPMAFQGHEERRAALKYLCPAVAYGLQCAGRAQCCRDAGIPESSCEATYGATLRDGARPDGGKRPQNTPKPRQELKNTPETTRTRPFRSAPRTPVGTGGGKPAAKRGWKRLQRKSLFMALNRNGCYASVSHSWRRMKMDPVADNHNPPPPPGG